MNKSLEIMKQTSELKVANHCEHCGRTFVRDSTLLKHLCEQKRRWMDADKPANRIAFSAWNEFYAVCQPSKRNKDYKAFIQSPYYLSFIKFGSYCVDVKAVGVPSYIKYLINGNVPIDNWNSDRVYSTFLIDYLRSEDSFDAIKRSISNMLSEAEIENIQLHDFFRYISSNKICHMIVSGRISPWLLYHSKSGIDFLSRLNDDQRGLIFNYIDPEKWTIKFRRSQDLVQQVSEILEEAKL